VDVRRRVCLQTRSAARVDPRLDSKTWICSSKPIALVVRKPYHLKRAVSFHRAAASL
jgi:hypothetical protein